MFSQFILPKTLIGKCLREIRLLCLSPTSSISHFCFFGYENQDINKEKEANKSAVSILSSI